MDISTARAFYEAAVATTWQRKPDGR